MKKNNRFEILTESGFQDFDGIQENITTSLKIFFSDGSDVLCSENHRFLSKKKEIRAATLKPNSILYSKRIVSVSSIGRKVVYDPINVRGDNTYLSDGLNHHNCAFLGSENTLINADGLRWMSPKKPIHSADGLDMFEMPVKDHVYVLIADIAKGVGGDYSAFSIIDISSVPYQQVAKYRDNNISPLLYPSVIYRVGTQYNMAYVLMEINISEQAAHILYYEMEYENVLFVGRSKLGQLVSSGFTVGTVQIGVTTDKKVKRIGCANLKGLIEEKKLIVHDADTISEFGTFIQKGDSFSADDTYHDDMVMTLVLFAWFTSNPAFKDFSDVNLRLAMYARRIQQIEEEMIPVGFFNNGIADDTQELMNF
jgi:hypothetical protein